MQSQLQFITTPLQLFSFVAFSNKQRSLQTVFLYQRDYLQTPLQQCICFIILCDIASCQYFVYYYITYYRFVLYKTAFAFLEMADVDPFLGCGIARNKSIIKMYHNIFQAQLILKRRYVNICNSAF